MKTAEYIPARELPLEELGSLPVKGGVHTVLVAFQSLICEYVAVCVFEHPCGPYVLLTSADKNEEDFAKARGKIVAVFGGEIKNGISDRGKDICQVIKVPHGFTRDSIRHSFVALSNWNYNGIRVKRMYLETG